MLSEIHQKATLMYHKSLINNNLDVGEIPLVKEEGGRDPDCEKNAESAATQAPSPEQLLPICFWRTHRTRPMG